MKSSDSSEYSRPAFLKDRYLVLTGRPSTDAARALGSHLFEKCFRNQLSSKSRIDRKETEGMLLAIAADVLSLREDRKVYRSLNSNEYAGGEVPYRSFKRAIDALEAQKLLKRNGGFRAPGMFEDSYNPSAVVSKAVYQRNLAARWQPTAAFLELCAGFGITPDNHAAHFIHKLPDHPLRLHAASKRKGHLKIRGKRIRFEPCVISEFIEGQVKEINEYLADFEIANATHRALRRIFNDGDQEGFNWNRGGRLYGDGPDNYQYLSKQERLKILINGEPVVEIDIRSSDLTIMHAKAGLKMPKGDAYSIEGFDRKIIKTWFVSAFGKGGIPVRWPRDSKDELKAANGGMLVPIKWVTEAVRKVYGPIIAYLEKSGIDSLDLQFAESQTVIETILQLKRNHNVPCLPVHDSLVVRRKDAEIAKKVLKDVYREKIGIEPGLTEHSPEDS